MSNRRTYRQVLVDLLRSTNGGPVSLDIIRGVLWGSPEDEPADWEWMISWGVSCARHHFDLDIRRINYVHDGERVFVGYQIVG